MSSPTLSSTITRLTLNAPGSTCSSELSANPWDTPSGYGPGASQEDQAPANYPRQQKLPQQYLSASDEELDARIRAAKETLGDDVVLLGHFYQRDEVVKYADFVGDSFQLANAALTRDEAKYIVFCGVHFMAETADVLSRDDQAVILPNLSAGCSMADMADAPSVQQCWDELMELYRDEEDDGRAAVIPVTYMNSSAALKAFVGRNGGLVCTSSNAKTVLEWAFERGRRVLFFPDQHLGRNTAKAMGIPLEQMPLWTPRRELGGNDADTLNAAKVILWHGFCSVHKRFTTAQIDKRGPSTRTCGSLCTPNAPWRWWMRRMNRFHRLHLQGRRRGHRTDHLRHRHGDQHGQPAGRAVPAAHDLLPGSGDLPLLHHVPHPPRLPGLGAGGTGGRAHCEPH